MRLPWNKDPLPADLAGHSYRADYEDPHAYDEELYSKLKAWRDGYASEWGLEPEDVLLESHLKHAAADGPSDSEELEELGLDDLRIAVLGEGLTTLVAEHSSGWRGQRTADPDGAPQRTESTPYEIFDSADHRGQADLTPIEAELPRD